MNHPFRPRGPTVTERIQLAACASLLLIPAFLLRGWWVEDAAIAFAYARNLAQGDGLVTFVGGERTEGYSDPLWILLLAAVQVVGLDPFLTSKVLGTLLAAATVPLVWAITRRVPGVSPRAPMFAALLAATSPLLGIWANAGLENPLFSLLLAAGGYLLLCELGAGRVGGRRLPWSSLLFLGLALTRTEGIVYAGFAVGIGALADVRRGSLRGAALRVLACVLPYVAYQLARYAYFALPFPLPYYAKVANANFDITSWRSRGWTDLRGWALECGWGFLFLVPVLGVTRGRWARGLGVGSVTLGILLLVPGTLAEHARMGLIAALILLLPVLALGRGVERVLLAGFATITVSFALLSNGDWMTGSRFYAQCVVPLAVAYAAGRGDLVRLVPARRRRLVGSLLTAVPIIWNLAYISGYAWKPESMTPFTTRGRVDSFQEVAKRIHMDRPWVSVDHAMGGHMWFAPPEGRTIDWYGLTDVTFALHRPVPGFAGDYLLKPARFDFAHMEAGFRRQKEFTTQFVEIPKGEGRTNDDWVRRALLTTPTWPGEPQVQTFVDGHRVEGVDVPAPTVAPGGALYVELGLSRPPRVDGEFSVDIELVGPQVLKSRVSAGYDGLFPPAKWAPGEIFVGRHVLPLPTTLPNGDYTLRVALVDASGAEIPPATDPHAVVVHIVSWELAQAAAEDAWARVLAAANARDCELADALWRDALHSQPADPAWATELAARAQTPLSECWSARSRASRILATQVEDLQKARRWDPRSPSANVVGAELAARLWPNAEAARAAGAVSRALTLFEAIVIADPTQSWARRYAEDARTVVLEQRRIREQKQERR